MSSFPLLNVQDAVAAADRLCGRIDAEVDPRRAVTGASMTEIASMAILVGQLDRIAKAAALFAARSADFDAWEPLQEQLAAAGYLPLPAPFPASPTKEPAHGEG